MEFYPWVVVGHVFFVILAFMAHGVSAFSMFQAKREPDPVVYATSRRKAEAFERQRRTLLQKYPRLAGLLLPMYQRLVKR